MGHKQDSFLGLGPFIKMMEESDPEKESLSAIEDIILDHMIWILLKGPLMDWQLVNQVRPKYTTYNDDLNDLITKGLRFNKLSCFVLRLGETDYRVVVLNGTEIKSGTNC